MRKISLFQFQNGEFSLRDEEIGQIMHSSIGAKHEAELLYGIPGADFIKNLSHPVVWDVASGTGANAVALLEVWGAAGGEYADASLEIHSFELFPETLQVTLENIEKFPSLVKWARILNALLKTGEANGEIAGKLFTWHMHWGDFQETHRNVSQPDLIFYDFYSPKVVPELWDHKLFKSMINGICDTANSDSTAAKSAIMTMEIISNHKTETSSKPIKILTYTSATWVRVHLLAAGLFIGSGTATELKNETTEASTDFTRLRFPFGDLFEHKILNSQSKQLSDEVKNLALEKMRFATRQPR